MGCAAGHGSLHIFLMHHTQHNGADDAGIAGNVDNDEAGNDAVHALAKSGGQRQHQQHGGNADDGIHQAHHKGIINAAEVSTAGTNQHSQHHGDCRDGDADKQAVAGAIQDSCEQVTAKVIGAEPVVCIGCLHPLGRVNGYNVLVIIKCKAGNNRRQNQHNQHAHGNHADRMPRKIAPGIGKRLAGNGSGCQAILLFFSVFCHCSSLLSPCCPGFSG